MQKFTKSPNFLDLKDPLILIFHLHKHRLHVRHFSLNYLFYLLVFFPIFIGYFLIFIDSLHWVRWSSVRIIQPLVYIKLIPTYVFFSIHRFIFFKSHFLSSSLPQYFLISWFLLNVRSWTRYVLILNLKYPNAYQYP